ncbi:unnamed protein product [Nippostrongylus brasiliensis]|uniref:Uncharacterized protein n=1 Tax=Nippostrongylus brasiliensis TaxID=27835 RepID=A0A0N4XE96_NIPBR|nr:unnamed protein product [Nippostrongylus brasiliensis]
MRKEKAQKWALSLAMMGPTRRPMTNNAPTGQLVEVEGESCTL